MTDQEISIIKLGGSLISPSQAKLLDFDFLSKFRELIKNKLEQGSKFGIITGGGSLMRMYRDMLAAQSITDANAVHWMGTTICVLHATIIAAYFGNLAESEVLKFDDFDKPELFKINEKIRVAGGAKPGHSSDVDAVIFAQMSNAKKVITLKNVDGVYTADPKKDSQATRIDNLSWDEYLTVIGNPGEFTPGGNYPVDPIASKMAKESGISFVVINGADLENFKNVLEGKQFIGTIIK